MSKVLIKEIHDAITSLQKDLNTEIKAAIAKGDYGVDDSPADMSARYWLMQFMEPLSRKELKSVVDGFMVQLLNDEQAKRLVKFLLARFPNYYKNDTSGAGDSDGGDAPCPNEGDSNEIDITSTDF